MDFKTMLQVQDPEVFMKCAAVIHGATSAIDNMTGKPFLIKCAPYYDTIVTSIGTGMTCALAKIFDVAITEEMAKEKYKSVLQAIDKGTFIMKIGRACTEDGGWSVAADFYNRKCSEYAF